MAKTVKKRGRLKKEYIYRRRRAVAALVLTIMIFGIIISAVSCSAIKKNKQDDTPVNLPVTNAPIEMPIEPEIELFEVDFFTPASSMKHIITFLFCLISLITCPHKYLAIKKPRVFLSFALNAGFLILNCNELRV